MQSLISLVVLWGDVGCNKIIFLKKISFFSKKYITCNKASSVVLLSLLNFDGLLIAINFFFFFFFNIFSESDVSAI